MDLTIAIEEGNYGLVLRLLDAGHDPNEIGKCNEAPLCIAARKNDTSTMKALMKFGADVNIISPSCGGTTALIAAARLNKVEALNLLLENGSDMDYVGECG